MKYFSLLNQKVVMEIRLCDKYTHRHPDSIVIKYNKTKFLIKTILATLFSIFVLLAALKQLENESSEYFIFIAIGVVLIFGYFIFYNLIRAISSKPILVINSCGIIVEEKRKLGWDSISSIYIKEYSSEEGVDYNLCIESEGFKWEEDFTGFNLRMDEISHWIAYFKLKHGTIS